MLSSVDSAVDHGATTWKNKTRHISHHTPSSISSSKKKQGLFTMLVNFDGYKYIWTIQTGCF